MRPQYNVDRRPDLDALRATMMLLVVVQFSAMPFFDSPWPIQDKERNLWYVIPYVMGNGFLLQAFFVVSGFFAARLLRTHGLKAVLWNWLRYLLLPVALTAITIVPVSDWMFQRAVKARLQESTNSKPICTASETVTIWCAAKEGNLLVVKKHLLAGKIDVNATDPHFGFTPLTWATIAGHIDTATLLLRGGAKVNGKNHDGGTALHEAALLGRDDVAEFLLLNGASMTAVDNEGKVVLSRIKTKWHKMFAKIGEWQIERDPRDVYSGRLAVANLLLDYKEIKNVDATTRVKELRSSSVWRLLTSKETVYNLWFLWHLCLLLPVFASLYALCTRRWRGLPPRLVRTPLCYLWLIPLTMIPLWYMSAQGTVPGFCSDISTTVIPPLLVLLYYGIFMLFGALYYDSKDHSGEVSKHWYILLPIGLLLVFPAGLTYGVLRFIIPNLWIGVTISDWQHLISVALQAAYSWVMIFATIGFFRRFVSNESRVWRYFSNSAFWLYLANLPLLLLVQNSMKTWLLPADIKYGLQMLTVGGVLLLLYEFLVRRTPLAKLLTMQHRDCPMAISDEADNQDDGQQPV